VIIPAAHELRINAYGVVRPDEAVHHAVPAVVIGGVSHAAVDTDPVGQVGKVVFD